MCSGEVVVNGVDDAGWLMMLLLQEEEEEEEEEALVQVGLPGLVEVVSMSSPLGGHRRLWAVCVCVRVCAHVYYVLVWM